jgi:hypothetical protein
VSIRDYTVLYKRRDPLDTGISLDIIIGIDALKSVEKLANKQEYHLCNDAKRKHQGEWNSDVLISSVALIDFPLVFF